MLKLKVVVLCVWGLGNAMAATVQVQVQDSGGKPLPDAVVFLESREARLLVKPAPDLQGALIYHQNTGNRRYVVPDVFPSSMRKGMRCQW